MPIESDGHSRGTPRLFELIEDAPREGPSPTVWAWPQIIDHLKVASQPVQGPWPPHQEPRPDPDADSLPVAVPDAPRRPTSEAPPSRGPTAATQPPPPPSDVIQPLGDA